MKNLRFYLMEALGLATFMFSACYFSAILESPNSSWHTAIPNPQLRLIIMAIMMGLTALCVFYSPLTAPSGAHINPSVTLAMLRIGNIGTRDALFYILFQFIGATLAVYAVAHFMPNTLTRAPVNYAATVPGSGGELPAAIAEFCTAFLMITMVLNTSRSPNWQKYTRVIAASMVVIFVIVAGPISGFGMNPARSFASALPSGIWTSFWIYILMPTLGMLWAAEINILIK
jgi:aquaporin Z